MTTRRSKLAERIPERDIEAAQLASHAPTHVPVKVREDLTLVSEDPDLGEVLTSGPPLREVVEADVRWIRTLQSSYEDDKFFARVSRHPEEHRAFKMRDGLIWVTSQDGKERLCITDCLYDQRKMREVITDVAHKIVGHLGGQKTAEYIRRWYWW
ncbi:hypothetical protein BV25DRAFT_1816462, partial [Artomyces pyxidatus]